MSSIMDAQARLLLLFFALNHILVDCTSRRVESPLTYKLNDGNEIPAIALGTSLGHKADGTRQLPQNQTLAKAVQWALEAGYRHVDTASLYRVEDEVGLGVRNFVNNHSDASRKDVYITTKISEPWDFFDTKEHSILTNISTLGEYASEYPISTDHLWNDAHERAEVIPALLKSLEELEMDYVDLYLVHYPMAYKKDGSISDTDYLTTWQGMEDAKRMNLTRSIGVSNFNITQMKRLWDNSNIKPAVLQIEVNPTITQDELVNWCHNHGVVVMGYSPFGAILGRKQDAPGPRSNDTLLQSLKHKYNKEVPQILLRYLLDRNIVALPRSTNKNRINMNIDIEDFKLTPEEVKKLSGFNKNYRLRTPVKWYDHPQFPFEKKNLTKEEIKYIIEHSKED